MPAGAIALARWGESREAAALLVHGTGFVADVWDEVARELTSTYTVYGSTAAATARATSRQPITIISWILPRISAG